VPSRRKVACALPWLLLVACSAQRQAAPLPLREPSAQAHGEAHAAPSARLASAIERFYWDDLERNPPRGSRLGYHQYDGRLPDVSPAAIASDEQRLRAAKAELEGVNEAGLSAREQLERDVVLYAIRGSLFAHERRTAFREPQSYVGPLALSSYVSRPYAPAEQRARAVIAIARASAAFLAQADANLERALPRAWLDTALGQARGMADFARRDVEPALGPLPAELRGQLHASLEGMALALDGFTNALQGRMTSANDDYALGEATFLRMLEETQGVPTSLAALEQVAEADLERNLAALSVAARQLDPTRSVPEVVARVIADKPALDAVLSEAEGQAQRARAFVLEHGIASIPSEHVAEVRVTPPFMRYNLAFLDGSGPFEKQRLPSFYYISPPDPSWPAEKQQAYVPDRWSLLSVTVHELWPGHFLHSLHIKRTGSRVLRTFRNYATSEGWAHYAEDMMWEQGFTPDPRFRIGQLLMALLRNVRLVCSYGLHARGMTVAQATALFREKAFEDEGDAQQQAVRGTFDPMYGSYTLGKLMIQKLRRDYERKLAAEGKPWSLRAFHDHFLSYGAAPIPLIRTEMLGADAGPVL
jgi:uncharacterized protein (DUF885 family)